MPDTMVAPALMDAAELARLLSVSKPTIWRLREAGRLPPAIALTSQCIRWQRDKVLAWIEGGCQPGGTGLPRSAEPVASAT